MPSHDVHRLLASRYLGLSEDVVRVIDRVVDLGPVHDVGRRMPRDAPKYLDILESGDVGKLIVLERRKSVAEILERYLSSEAHVKAFYFHHALDMLALRLASVLILELDVEKMCCSIAEGAVLDLYPIEKNLVEMKIFVPIRLEDLEEELKNALTNSRLDRLLIKWVKNNIVPNLTRYQSLDYIKTRYIEKMQKIVKADARYETGLSLGIVAMYLRHREEFKRMENLLDRLLGRKEATSEHLEDLW
ncbi:MAG: hypothetical protein DRO12_04040 [Thermoprotei archaeon]|nr:MAG: hypothetical protein DRO12_04040 [Thermoprotei archaeon]